MKHSTLLIVAALILTIGNQQSALGNTIHYVWTNSPSATPPYTNWATAAHVIQDAVDAAADGDTVLVTNGVYRVGGGVVSDGLLNRVALTNAVLLQSVNGADRTWIEGNLPVGNTAIRGVYMSVSARLSGFTITNGATASAGDYETQRRGGGVWCESTNALIGDCTLVANESYHNGGGAYRGTFVDCVFIGNRSRGSEGGGAYKSNIYRSTLTQNSGSSGGAAGHCTVVNCRVYRNSATMGGGLHFGSALNCTVVDNSAEIGGGATHVDAVNCIVYFNHITQLEGPNTYGGTQRYCCTAPLQSGEGNMSNDPLIAGISNSRLLLGSPCIGTGSDQESMIAATDFDGEGRRSGRVDIGADEFWESGLTGSIAVAIGTGASFVTPGFPVDFEAAIDGKLLGHRWEMGDGTSHTNQYSITHEYARPGLYEILLVASNLDGVTSANYTVTVERATYYVAVAGDDGSAGTNWATAKATIQNAIDNADTWGSTIYVSNGVYAVGGSANFPVDTRVRSRVCVYRPLRVCSVNGPGVTEITGELTSGGADAVRCASLVSGASLVGFTLRGGRTLSVPYVRDTWLDQCGAGVWCESDDASISNCVFAGNEATYTGGGVYQGSLIDCMVVSNTASGAYGGGAYRAVLRRCSITENVGFNGGGAAICLLEDCLISANHSPHYGGGAYDCELINCTVVGNDADVRSGGVDVSAKSVKNCIIVGNVAPESANWRDVGASSIDYTCTTPLPAGDSNVDADPLFLDPGRGVYTLAAFSPCIDTGNRGKSSEVLSDLAGNPRVYNGTVDMGCYEYTMDTVVSGCLSGPLSPFLPEMTTGLGSLIPIQSPFAQDLRESDGLPTGNTTDWLLVALLATNNGNSMVAAHSVLLQRDGRLLNMRGGISNRIEVSAGWYYVSLEHRNHVAVMSAIPLAFTNRVVSYDFTTGPEKYYGDTNACIQISSNLWGMIPGDADADGRITQVDWLIVSNSLGNTGYLQADLNLDGEVTEADLAVPKLKTAK